MEKSRHSIATIRHLIMPCLVKGLCSSAESLGWKGEAFPFPNHCDASRLRGLKVAVPCSDVPSTGEHFLGATLAEMYRCVMKDSRNCEAVPPYLSKVLKRHQF